MTPFGLGLNASTIRGTPVLRQIHAASVAGFDALELWFADTDAHVAAGGTLAELRRALDDAGLAVPTLIYVGDWFDVPEARWPEAKERCVRRFAEAAVLGAPHVIAAPPAGAADAGTGARRYRELLELGAREGALPAFEFLGFVGHYRTLESALEILNLADHPAASTVVDPFHVFRGGGSFESLSRLRASQIAVSHFNDAPARPERERQHDADRVWPGQGCLDLRRYLELLARTGYRGVLSLELFREDLWRLDPLEVAREGMRRLRTFLD
ncbi:MAG: sugar phosphate isomerase/epimerase [Verrucomicrobiales bacterium]|nr:sugar phosphate isomerase/epimerase [Verrucomicrobiales bacterium]